MKQRKFALLACTCVLAASLAACSNGQLEEENATLTANLEAVTAELEDATASLDAKAADLEAAQADLENAQADLEAVTTERDQLADDNEKIAADLEAVTAERDDATAESEQLAASVEQLSADVESATTERDKAAADLEAITAERDQATADVKQLSADLEALTAEQSQAAAETEELTASVDLLSSDLETVTAERDELAAQVEALTAERDQLAADLEALQAEYDAAIAAVPEQPAGQQSEATDQPVDQPATEATSFVGRWVLVEVEGEDDESSTSREDIEMLASLGMYNYIDINEDGTAEYILFGVPIPGTWTTTSETTAVFAIDPEAISDGEVEDAAIDLSLEGNRLLMTGADDGGAMYFEQGAYEVDENAAGISGLIDDQENQTYEEVTEPVGQVIVDDELITIEVVDKKVDVDGDLGYDLRITNNSDEGIYVSESWFTWSVAGQQVDPVLGVDVDPGETVEDFMWFSGNELGVHELDGLTGVTGELSVQNNETYDEIATYEFALAGNPLAGTWELVEMTIGEGTATLDDIKVFADLGLYTYLEVAENGAATLSVLGGSVPAAIELADETTGTFTVNEMPLDVAFDGERLTIAYNDKSLVFARDAYEIVKASAPASAGRTFDTTGQVVADDELVTIEVLGKRVDSWGDPGYDLRIVNNSDKTILVGAKYGTWSVDGKMMDPFFSTTIQPGKYAEEFLYYSAENLDADESDPLEALVNVEGVFNMMDDESWDELGTYSVAL